MLLRLLGGDAVVQALRSDVDAECPQLAEADKERRNRKSQFDPLRTPDVQCNRLPGSRMDGVPHR
jgi:hypothetical protein